MIVTDNGVEEIHETGDAFYVPDGRFQRAAAGIECVQLTRAGRPRVVSETMMRNIEDAQTG